MPKKPKAEMKAYGELKSPRQFTITETASDKIDRLADLANLSRSEFIEQLVRWADANESIVLSALNPQQDDR